MQREMNLHCQVRAALVHTSSVVLSQLFSKIFTLPTSGDMEKAPPPSHRYACNVVFTLLSKEIQYRCTLQITENVDEGSAVFCK